MTLDDAGPPARPTITLRDARPEDAEPFIALAQVAFAEEMRVDGLTPEAYAQQMRAMSRGRLIPMRLLMALAGMRWRIIIAEHEGKIVGGGAYSGRGDRVHLLLNMVDPAYRRQGITTAIMAYGLPRLQKEKVRWAIARVLSTNDASRENLLKQGFTVFHETSSYEKPLAKGEAEPSGLQAAPVSSVDRATIQALRDATIGVSAEWLHLLGDAADDYLVNPIRRAMMRLSPTHYAAWRFTLDGALVGYLASFASRGATKGTISIPLVDPPHVAHLPAMLRHAEQWLTALGKTEASLTAPTHHEAMRAVVEGAGYVETRRWLRLVRAVPPDMS